ncbi:hypothetical protein D3C75_792760 [compost metagenome]
MVSSRMKRGGALWKYTFWVQMPECPHCSGMLPRLHSACWRSGAASGCSIVGKVRSTRFSVPRCGWESWRSCSLPICMVTTCSVCRVYCRAAGIRAAQVRLQCMARLASKPIWTSPCPSASPAFLTRWRLLSIAEDLSSRMTALRWKPDCWSTGLTVMATG